MSVKISATEEHIKETAKKVFLKEGRYNATTQEIADAAGVNRTLLHYYFRSREVLLEKVLLEGQMEFRQKMSENVGKELPFKERISRFIDVWMEHTLQYPYLDAYLVTQMHTGNLLENLELQTKNNAGDKARFFKEMEAEMKAGRISQMEPIQFLLNLISMVSYPLIMRPLMEKALSINKKSYNKVIAERKEAIMSCLFK
mgnify:FL=1